MDGNNSFYEILQDSFCIKILLEIKRKVKNVEAKNYLVEFIKDISASMLYEISVFLERRGYGEKKQFFDPKVYKQVREYRQWLKHSVFDSKKIAQKVEHMGIDYSHKIYDLNIILKYNKVLAFNFENFDSRNDVAFVDGILRFIEKISIIIFQTYGLDIDNIDSMTTLCLEKLQTVIKRMERTLSGSRYSYSAFKLFSLDRQLTTNDKNFILERYRLVSSIIEIEKIFGNLFFEIDCQPLRVSFKDFMRKYRAIIIDILGLDLRQPKSEATKSLKKELEKQIDNEMFYELNKKVRNNLHYNEITALSEAEKKVLDKYQTLYLHTILDFFNSIIFVDIDENDKTITNLVKYCAKHGISKQVLEKNSVKMFNEFRLTNRIMKDRYQ